MKTQSLEGKWKFRQRGSLEWFPATVPGGVHTDLMASGKIPDPFVGDNEKKVQWVAECDWDYEYSFIPSAEIYAMPQLYLVCDGIDTLASVKLNGIELGRTNNMFRQYRWDIKSIIKSGENILDISFDSPVRYCAEKQAEHPMAGVSQAIPGGPHLRKAPCQFGWDWGPQLPPIGIWKSIRLEGYDSARIENVHLRQIHSDGKVRVESAIYLETWKKIDLEASMAVIAPDGKVFRSSTKIADKATLSVDVSDPQLWWPNGYGEQPLYNVEIEIRHANAVLDAHKYQLGLRTIELRQQPDEWGKSFTFVVNGLPIMAKGSDWIPADSFPTRITPAYLEALIKAAADTHQNMLRVWGGGFYEDERFYDLCDRYGILVWQDFVFACSLYPFDDAEFVENLHVEMVENIRRLRHRASLALWCGNNEMEWGWVDWGWKGSEFEAAKVLYDQFFHHTLPAWIAAEDTDHAYWPSSPSSGTPFVDPNGQKQGDSHYWDVWHGRKPFTAYRSQYPRFMSEFGFQSLPPMPTIKSFAEKPDWNMTSYIMERHQKNDSGNQLMVAQMLDTFRLPKDFESLVYLSMVLQAEGIRYGVEHWRRYPKRVSGIIYWQLNDCWPVASWSSLDYFLRWKALHYAARKFYAPVLMSIEDKPTSQSVYITNETRDVWHGSIRWTLETLNGKVVSSGEETVEVAPFDAAKICFLDFTENLIGDRQRDLAFVAELIQNGDIISRQVAYFVPTKHLNLMDPEITAKLTVEGNQIAIELNALTMARLVECSLEGADIVFSDNYFDLPAKRTAKIIGILPAGWTITQVQKALKIRSIYDSFAH